MTVGWPMEAAMPARAAAALPVEAVAMNSACFSRPLTTAMADARSLNDAVGSRESSLT